RPRRRQRLAAAALRDAADALAGDPLQPDHGHHHVVPGVHEHLRHDRRRTFELDAGVRALPLPERVPVLPHGLRVRHGVGADGDHRRRAGADLPHVGLGVLRGPLVKARRTWGRVVLYLVLIAGALFFLTPFAWMVSTSLKPDDQVFLIPPTWIPDPPMWSNYLRLMTEIPFLRYFGNTVFVTVLSVTFYLASSAVVAYGFAKLRWPGREMLFYALLATMVLPPQVTLIPQFVMFQKLGW